MPVPPSPPGGGGPEGGRRALILPAAPARDPVLILILNLLGAAGAGYILMGQTAKGIVAIVLFAVVAIPTCFSASGLIALVAAVDGYLQARALESGYPIAQWTFFNDHR